MTSISKLLILGSMLGVVVAPASADEQDARRIFKEMSDYLAEQTTFSFDYDAALDLVTKEGQTLTLASSGSASVARPDKISASRTGGFAEIDMAFDGKTLTFVSKSPDTYAEVDIPGDLDNLIDTLRDTYQRPLPAADLLMSDVDGQLMPLVSDVKDLGSGVVGGVECNHFAFRTEDVDWQIWIAAGDDPYPVRRQRFWDNRRRELTEVLAHQGCHIRRPLFDEASVVG